MNRMTILDAWELTTPVKQRTDWCELAAQAACMGLEIGVAAGIAGIVYKVGKVSTVWLLGAAGRLSQRALSHLV